MGALAQDGQNDATFNTGEVGFTVSVGANNRVIASAIQADSKIIIGGLFTSYNGVAQNRIARLNEDGTIDATFNVGTGANSGVRSLVLQSDGKVLVGGDFGNYNGTAKIALMRLNNDGTLDNTFIAGAGPDGGVFKIIPLSTGKILIVGAFTTYNGTARNRIAVLNADGSLDTSFDPGTGADATIQAAAIQSDGKIMIAGNFLNYNGTLRSRIARLNSNGSLDTAFDPGTGFDAEVRTISLQSTNKIIAGGIFTTFNGTTVNYITRLNTNGTRDTTFGSTGCNVSINTSIEDILMLPDDRFVIVGGFAEYNSVLRIRIARINSNGSLDTSFNPGTGADNVIFNISRYTNGKMFIGGVFTAYNGVTRTRVGRLNEDGTFHVGGVGATFNVRSAKAQADGKVIVVGEFTGFDGKIANRIVRVLANGNTDASFNTGSGTNSVIRDVAIQSDQKIIIVGDFATYNGVGRAGIARLNSDGTLDTSFTPGTGANSGIYSIVIQSDGKILIGGVFTNYNGTAINRIARLNSDGTLDTSFVTGSGFNSVVRMLALQADGKLVVAGDFTAYNGQLKTAIARVNTNGTFDTSFAGSGTNLLISAVAIQSDGKVLIGGDFTTINGTAKNRLARLNSDGSVDNSFDTGSGPNFRTNAFTIEQDGQIIIGGEFTNYGGVARNRIARINSDGSLDTTFNPGTGADNSVFSLTLQTDGVIIGGSFVSYNGVTRNRIAKSTICPAPMVTSVTPGSRCSTGTVTLNATASAGTLNWYSTLTGGTSLGTGTGFVTPSIGTTTTYYVDATDNSCTSGRAAVVATVSTAPTITGSTPSARCGTGTLTLSATASAGTLNWYAAASGGSSLETGTNFTTPSISNTTTYYVDATDNGCTSSRTAVIATVNTTPSVTGSTPSSRCDAGTVSLGATASAGTLNWYAASTGGSSLGTGPTFITPSISLTSTYYVDATNNGCTSARIAVTATVNASPTVTGTLPSSRCGTGTITLAATASAGVLNWYAASLGGSSLGTGTSFTTPSIATPTTYYVDASNAGCTSSRTAVIATVNTIPTIVGTTPASRCGTGTVSLGAATGGGTLNWYATSTGGVSLGSGTTFITPSLTTTSTYYVDVTNNGCTSVRTPVVATIDPIPNIIGTTPSGRCDVGTVTLGASTSAGILNWYAASSGGISLGTGTSFITPSLSASTTYYVDATNTGCTSARTAVIATISVVPTITGTTSGTRCGTGTVTLSATGSAGTLNWYAASTGGTVLGTGLFFITPSITNTTTYYVDVTDGCTSARTAVVATVNPVPTITGLTPANRCGTGTITLGATTGVGTLNWYTASTGGTSQGTGTSFVTPSIANTTTYYVDVTNNGCTSARNAVIATIDPIPTITSAISNDRCNTGAVTIGATASAGALNWFGSPTGGTSLGTGATFSTPVITSTTTYYVEATSNGCTSPRTAIIANINTTPTITSTTPASRCGAGIVDLSATADVRTLNWYSSAIGGSSLASGFTFTTPSVTTTTTYYVEAVNNGCTSARSTVIVTINAVPSITNATPATVANCVNGSTMLSASADFGAINWYSVPSGGISLGAGTNFITPEISSSTTFYAEASQNGCRSTRAAVTATVNEAPIITATLGGSQCDSGSISLSAAASGGIISWYADTTGGTALGTGTNFTTPTISATATYYVEAADNGCTSARTAVTANINPTPTITSTTPASRCGTGDLMLSASGSADVLNWYDVATGGTSLAAGRDFATPSIATTTTFYVEASANGCASSRIAVVATINAVPSIVTTTPASAATCDSGTVTLGATADAGTINWFAAGTGGTALGTGNSFITPLLTTTTTYYVEVTNNGCTSTRTVVAATINSTPPRPTITADNASPIAPLLTSSSSNGNQWFRDAVAISGATASTLVIQQAGVFTVRVTQKACVSPFSTEYTYVVTALEPTLVSELSLYPNPVVEELVVGLGGFDPVVPIQILIRDIQARDQLETSSIGKTKIKIDIQHFASGQYVVVVEQGKTKLTKRFIKK